MPYSMAFNTILTEAVVFTTHGLLRATFARISRISRDKQSKHVPRVTSNANDGNGAAAQSNLRGDVLDDNTKEAEKRGHGGLAGRRHAVAALSGAGVALVRRVAAGGDGHGEGSEGEGGEGREGSELHFE